MTDYFALLDEPRCLWVDVERLRSKFLALSGEAHPDKAPPTTADNRETTTRKFTELNAAFTCLRDPKERLRHWLSLELGSKPSEVLEIPSDLADLFIEIAALQRGASAFLTEAAGVHSPLLRVQMFERLQEWIDRLRALQARLCERQADLLRELQVLDGEWVRLHCDPIQRRGFLQRVEQIYQRLSFYTRWTAQIQETLVQLAQ